MKPLKNPPLAWCGLYLSYSLYLFTIPCALISLNSDTWDFRVSDMKFHHIGIAVKELEASCSFFENILARQFSEPEIVDSQKVRVCYAGTIELVEATQEQSPLYAMMRHPILNFIEKNGEGVHHLCFEVEDMDATLEELSNKGIKTLTEKPQQGSSNSRIIFLNPKSCNNLLIELKETINE